MKRTSCGISCYIQIPFLASRVPQKTKKACSYNEERSRIHPGHCCQRNRGQLSQSPMSSTIIKLAAEKCCLTEGREFAGERSHLSKTIFYFFIFSSYFSDCNVIISFFSFLSSLQFPSYILPCF